jgi:hypothetical protein
VSKKTLTATIIVLVFLVSPVGGIFVFRVADANPAPQSSSGEINITVGMLSPENKSYNAPDVWLEVEAGGFPGIYYVGYSLDGGPFIDLTTNSTRLYHTFDTRILLEGLYNGTHHLVAKADVIFDIVPPACSEIYFTMLNSKTPSPTPTLTPSPSPSPTQTLNASLSESASALNFGNTINFTVSVEGGKAPYTYTWNIEQSSDVVLVETSTSPYYSSNIFGPGSHHVYVEVRDADNNTAKTLTVEFNVLASSSSSASSSPTTQPTLEPSQTPDRPRIGDFAPVLIPASMILLGIVAVGLLVYFGKRRG